MHGKMTDFIKYSGLNPLPLYTSPYFKELNCGGVFLLPPHSPAIEDLLSVNVKAKIEFFQPTKSTPSRSLEGHIITPFQLLIIGTIYFNYQYTSSGPDYSIHHGEHRLPFCNTISLPHTYKSGTTLYPKVTISDIFSYHLNAKTIYHNIAMTLLI